MDLDITIIIRSMIELCILMFFGYFLFKIGMLNNNFVKRMTKLILDVTLPAQILASVFELTERQSTYDVVSAIIVFIVLLFIVLPVLGFLIAKLIRAKKNHVGLYTFMTVYSNCGFMGFPVISAICGPTGLFYAAMYNLIFNLSIYTLGKWMMAKDLSAENKFDPKDLLSPGVLVAVFALIVYFVDIKLPLVITDSVSMLGSMTSPAAMLVIGCSLAKMDVKSIFTDIKIYPWTIISRLIMPILLWFPLSLVIKNTFVLQITYILVAMPVANSAVLFSTNFGGDTDLAAKTIFITTILSLITVPLCIMIV